MRNHRWFAPAAAVGHYIPENTMVGAFPELLNRDPHRWPNLSNTGRSDSVSGNRRARHSSGPGLSDAGGRVLSPTHRRLRTPCRPIGRRT